LRPHLLLPKQCNIHVSPAYQPAQAQRRNIPKNIYRSLNTFNPQQTKVFEVNFSLRKIGTIVSPKVQNFTLLKMPLIIKFQVSR